MFDLASSPKGGTRRLSELFYAQRWPGWGPLFWPLNPSRRLCQSPFCAHGLFLGAAWRLKGGGQRISVVTFLWSLSVLAVVLLACLLREERGSAMSSIQGQPHGTSNWPQSGHFSRAWLALWGLQTRESFIRQKTREGSGCPKFLSENRPTSRENLDCSEYPSFSGIMKCYSCQGLGGFLEGRWLRVNRPRARERSWIFSSETATAFLSSSEIQCLGRSECGTKAFCWIMLISTFESAAAPGMRTLESKAALLLCNSLLPQSTTHACWQRSVQKGAMSSSLLQQLFHSEPYKLCHWRAPQIRDTRLAFMEPRLFTYQIMGSWLCHISAISLTFFAPKPTKFNITTVGVMFWLSPL